MKKYKSFETERLFIRPTTEEDATLVLALLNTPNWLKHIGDRQVYTVDDARNYIKERMLPQLERLGFGTYTMIRKSDQAKIGTCGLFDREGLNGVDIGYALLPEYERQGYVIEAAERIKQAAFDDFSFTVLYAITTHQNVASQRILEKLGMHYETVVRLEGDPEELRLYELTAEEFSK
ncbi:GNAT family N-acetyltransferase [Mangrovibacterium lignilyticum]|uniref:GNAT family N-acetyltransferase n=1 Tax=Mangrovibacterium lignilyticum TaxID=2668052 RepID=UPI0013D49070|nr:GNAT family N-acetyltransferase [Mangrovibacterium lignilyticum]